MAVEHASRKAREATQIIMSESTEPAGPSWFGPRTNMSAMAAFGLKLAGGGAHQSKTMMLNEISAILDSGLTEFSDIKRAVIEENVLGIQTQLRPFPMRIWNGPYALPLKYVDA